MSSYLELRLDATTSTKSAKSYKDLKCKIEQCGGRCLRDDETCRLIPDERQKKIWLGALKSIEKPPSKTTSTSKSKLKKAVATELHPAIKTNAKALDAGRKDLVKRVGEELVKNAENNTHKILNDKNTDVFIRVGSSETLEKILGDRFKGAVELGVTGHSIPHLKDKDYTVARKRVEELNGYSKDAKPEDRPISGYFGSSDLKGASHADVSQAYGSIAVKLKPQVKERVTFTGADSFKSGIPSPLNPKGTPPPPSAASIASLTRHGYELDKLPSGYPSFYKDEFVHEGQLKKAVAAKDINDLVKAGAPTGNAYVEAQIHGQVKPSDIAELHFSPKKENDKPNAAIAEWAKKNGVKIFVNGKEANLDKIIKPPKKSAKLPASDKKTDSKVAEKYVRRKELDLDRERIVAKIGEEKVKQVEKKVKDLLKKADLHIRVPGSSILEKIIDDRFKTQFETGTSKGALSSGMRKDAENWLHKYSETKTRPENRPIYGFVANADSIRNQKDDGKRADHYGNTIVRLKSEVKDRATITGNDSLAKSFRPSPVNNPSIVSFMEQYSLGDKRTLEQDAEKILKAKTLNEALPSWGYWEFQAHEKVNPSDIAEVVFTKGDKPSRKVKDWAAANGVKLTIA